MAIKVVPFGAFAGFSDQPIAGAHYYSQNFSPSLFGTSTMYSLVNERSSIQVSGMGNIKWFATGPGGSLYAQDNNGNILKEQNPGAYDFAIVRSPGGNGAGLMGDQYGNLLYANGSSNNQLGLFDGTTWTDNYQSLTSWQHPMDTYEDLRLIGNKNAVACIFSDNTYNSAAFTLPSSMSVDAISGGPTGILIGANFGSQGAIVLWDGNALRAKTPWKWTQGRILSIAKYGVDWIVKTQRQVLLTNGVTVKILFNVFDDPLSLKSYSSGNDSDLGQQLTVINNFIVFLVPRQPNGPLTYEFGKLKPGVYLYSLTNHAWVYLTVPTGNTITVDAYAVFPDITNNRILVSYYDAQQNVSYIASLTNTPPITAQFVSEALGIGHPHYQRVYFGPTDKLAEAVVLNLGILNSLTDPVTQTFNVALKIYNFKRQLWGKSQTNAQLTNKNQLRVDGTNTAHVVAQVGDEVTVLCGENGGLIAHITAIANQGTTTETWTLDTTFPNQTEANVYLNVEPWVFVQKQSFSNLSQLKNIFFNVNREVRGKQFLAKFVFDGMGTGLQLEIQTSYMVWDDIGYDQT